MEHRVRQLWVGFTVAGWTSGALGLGVAAACLLVYGVTLAPGVPPTDSGELALAAWLPGVAHAPGFPLYTALGWLWTHVLSAGRVVWRLNLLSAVSGAAAVGLTYALAFRTLRFAGTTSDRTGPLLAAAIGAVALGLGRTVWSWATVAEVYALNLLLTAAILVLVLASGGTEERKGGGTEARTGSKRQQDTEGREPRAASHSARYTPRAARYAIRITLHAPRTTFIIAAAFLFGLGLGGHLTSMALLAPAIAFWLTARHGWRFWISKTALFAGAALLAGAAIYLWLPLRAVADPLLNWGQPDTWQRFWWHVTAKQYRVSLFSAPVWPQVKLAAELWWTQFTPVGLVLLLWGAWRMARSQPRLFGLLALVVVFITLYAWAYVIEDDGDAYYLPAFLAGSIWVAWGAAVLAARTNDFFSRKQAEKTNRTRMSTDEHRFIGGWPSLAALLVVPVAALIMNWAACDRRGDVIPEDYVRDTFAEIGGNGLLLTRDWQLYAPALYLQQVEGLRPDLAVIDTELLRRGWYFDLLHRLYPDLMASVAAEERAFLALRDAWERGDLPDSDLRLGDLQAAYIALLDAFIDQAAAAGRPVHIGPNRGAEALRNATLNGQPDMEAGVGVAWQWLPVGLSFRAMSFATTVETLHATSLQWRVAPFARVIPTAPERKIQATRADMATLHGLVQANLGNLSSAEADWRLALTIDPKHAAATELLNRLKGQQ